MAYTSMSNSKTVLVLMSNVRVLYYPQTIQFAANSGPFAILCQKFSQFVEILRSSDKDYFAWFFETRSINIRVCHKNVQFIETDVQINVHKSPLQCII